MSETIQIITGVGVGFLLGLFFYGGLKFTLRKGLKSKFPALWFLLSFLLRTGIVVAGFYFFSGGNWKTLLACLVGFTISRFVLTGFKTVSPRKPD